MSRGFSLIELMITVGIVGVLTAIALPNFARFQARSKQSEAKVNLKAMFTGQKAFAMERDRFPTFTSEIGFSPERNNRYAYFLGQGGSQEDRSAAVPGTAADNTSVQFDSFRYAESALFPAAINVPPSSSPCDLTLPGVHSLGGDDDHSGQGGGGGGGGPAMWTGMAQGQIDGDGTLDLWSISSSTRSAGVGAACASAGLANPAGEPLVETNDVTN